MKKQILPSILIIASVIMIIINSVMSEEMDNGFWMRNVSSVLLIFAMILTLRSQKEK